MLIVGIYENEIGQLNWITKEHWVVANGNDSVVSDIGYENYFNDSNFFVASNSTDSDNVELDLSGN